MTDLARIIAAVAPDANASVWSASLEAPMHSAGIVTPRRIAMFLGQCAEETGDFRALSEDLYYSTSGRIREVWPTHFADVGEAMPYVGRPAALANRVYANRMGNGDEESGDGWRFRGRGLIQITGRQMYEAFARADTRAADPDWLLTPAGAAVSACWYWGLSKAGRPSLNALADDWDIRSVTMRINGGYGTIPVRARLANAALAAFGAPDDVTSVRIENPQNPASFQGGEPPERPIPVRVDVTSTETTAQLNDAEYDEITKPKE